MPNENDFLAHHGVKGQRWGIRKKVRRAVRRFGSKVNKKVSNRLRNFKESREKKKEIKTLAKSNGVRSRAAMKKFNELRRTTLASHDPVVIAKGMHTLTDKELQKKIDRMHLEETMAKKAHDVQSNAVALKKAKAEARKAGILGILATGVSGGIRESGKTVVEQAFKMMRESDKDKQALQNNSEGKVAQSQGDPPNKKK